MPVALRIDATVSTALALVTLAGGAALVLGPATALIGGVPLHRGSPARAVLAGVCLCATPLAVFGAMLHERTHHRALGGATFGMVSVLLVLGAVVVARRVPIALGARLERPACLALEGLAAVSLMGAVVAAAGGAAPSVRDGLLDAAIGVLAFGVVLRLRKKLPRHLIERAAWGWLALVVVGLGMARLQPNLRETLASQAPVVYALGGWAAG